MEYANIKAPARQLAWEAGTDGGHHTEELVTWLFEPESFAPLAKLTKVSTYGIISDHLGTPVSMHAATGEAVWSADLNAYGEVLNLRGKAGDCPFRYPGQYEDVETGLYFNRFRYYDPREGMYVSQDPIGLWGGFSLYSYVHDNNSWVDVFGLSGVSWMDTADIELSHPAKLSTPFSDPRRETVGDLAQELARNPAKAKEIPPIQIAKIKGKWYSANNRRLLAFKKAGVNVPTIPASKEQIKKIKQRLSKKC